VELPLELERAIQNAPDDRDGYLVAADWLQQAGAPQGELVTLSVADDRDEIIDRMIELKQELLPVELRTLSPASIEWRWGWVRGAHLTSVDDPIEPQLLRNLLVSPIGRFLQKLVLDRPTSRILEALYSVIDREPRALRCLRTLMIFMPDRAQDLDLAQLSRLTTLRRLALQRVSRPRGVLVLPELLELVFDKCEEVPRVLAGSALPALDTLSIDGPVDVPANWLDPIRLPALRSITLTERYRIAGSAISAQLEQVDRIERTRGQPTIRLVVVGRAHKPGTAVAIEPTPFRIGRSKRAHLRIEDSGVTMRHLEIYRPNDWRTRGDNTGYVNGHSIQNCQLRSMDELAIGDHVFRFLEGDGALVDRTRARYGL